MILCYSNNKDSFKTYGLEIVHASQNGKLRLYNKKQKKFFKDIDCTEEVEVKGEKILTRAVSDGENGMLAEAILKQGGEVICNDPISNSNIRRWPKFVQTQRKMAMVQGTELLEYDQKQLQQILDTVSDGNETIFFKTKSGDFSRIIRKDELLQEDSVLRRIIAKYPDEEYILSQHIQIEQDKLGTKEYRSIVIDNKPDETPKIASISRYSSDTYHQVPNEVLEECRRLVNTINSSAKFPEKYVLDIVEYEDSKTGKPRIELLGLKPINLALFDGLYNSIDDLEQEQELSDEQLCHEGSEIYNIAPEKKKDFINRGEIPSTLSGKKVIPLEQQKETKFAEAYKLGHEIVKSKLKFFSFLTRQPKANEKQPIEDEEPKTIGDSEG